MVLILLNVSERVLNLLAGDLVDLARPVAWPAPAGHRELLEVRELARPTALVAKAGRPPLRSGLVMPVLLNLILVILPLLLLLLLLLSLILHLLQIQGLLLVQELLLLLSQVPFELFCPGVWRLPLIGAKAAPRHYLLGAADTRESKIVYVEMNACGPSYACGLSIICPLPRAGIHREGRRRLLLLDDAWRLPFHISSCIVSDFDKSSHRVSRGLLLQELAPSWVELGVPLGARHLVSELPRPLSLYIGLARG